MSADSPKNGAGAPVPEEGRRELLGAIAIGAGSCAALAAVVPLAGAVLSPAPSTSSGEESESDAPYLDVAAEADVKSDLPLRVELRAMRKDGWLVTEQQLGAAWLVRTPGGVQAFSATCPHLGCAIERDVSGFLCPCHESRFDGRGATKSGPSPRALDPLPVRLVKGRVHVQALRFLAGGATRKVIG